MQTARHFKLSLFVSSGFSLRNLEMEKVGVLGFCCFGSSWKLGWDFRCRGRSWVGCGVDLWVPYIYVEPFQSPHDILHFGPKENHSIPLKPLLVWSLLEL